jgi:hypothetical protein
MRRRLLLLSSLFLLLPTVSCDDPTAPDGLRITARNQQLLLENTGDEPIYTFALDMEMLALVDWVPCVGESCGRIMPGATRMFTYEQLESAPGRLVRIYYWRELPGVGPLPRPGPVISRELRLPPISFP